MANVIVKILALTCLLVQSISFMSAMDNNNNRTNDLPSRIRALILKLKEQEQKKLIIEQIQNKTHDQSPEIIIEEKNNNQKINDLPSRIRVLILKLKEQEQKKLIIEQIQNKTHDQSPEIIIEEKNNNQKIDEIIDDHNNDKEDISEHNEKSHQELQTYTLSDFEYVQDLTQEDFIEYCGQEIFSKDLLWIGKIDKKEFKQLQSTKQLQEILLQSTISTSPRENTKHLVINISNNMNENNNNKNNNNNEYSIYENETETRECTLCMDELPASQFISLDCGHNQFCKTCLVDVFKPGLKEKNSKLWKCPANGCTHHMTKNDREKILTHETIYITELSTLPSDEEYTKEEIKFLVKNGAFAQDKPMLKECDELVEREEFLNNPKIKFCPIDYCKGYFKVRSYENRVRCNLCKNKYCNQCLKNHKKDTSCEEHERFLNMGNEEKIQESNKWLQENTKPCPNCKQGINKDGGCQHMTCDQCKHEFCWICLAKWGNKYCSYYSCNNSEQQNNNNNNNNPIIIEENNYDSSDDSIDDTGDL